MGITANKLLSALLDKHSDDVCVPECKTGASWIDPNMRKLDLWVMRKSWRNPNTYGYEIKVSRQDFLRDEKWREYLVYCNEFYFVAPQGIIAPEELPLESGLMVASKNGSRLFTKKKAPHRDVQIPEDIFRYILMWRCKIVTEIRQGAEYWKNGWKKEMSPRIPAIPQDTK